MRPSGLPTFRKLYGRIDNGLDKGSYKINVMNNYNVTAFSGSKTFLVTTVNAWGGINF
jgi:hypothetical protein